MRLPALLALVLLLLGPAPAFASGVEVERRVLFVGNSLTYVGNVPAVFDALAKATGRRIASDMIVRGGATLSQRLADASVKRALHQHAYSALVLQERGGDLLCAFGPDSCVQSRQAIHALAALGRQRGVPVFLLGSYQADPVSSRRLVDEEAAAAAAAGVKYIEVSEKLQRLRKVAGDLHWFAADGMHPGPHLALLNAVLVHQVVLGVSPDVAELSVRAPIYDVRSGLTEALRQADAPPPLNGTPMRIDYPASHLRRLVEGLPRDGQTEDGALRGTAPASPAFSGSSSTPSL